MGLSGPYRVVTTTSSGDANVDTVDGLQMLGVRSCLSDRRQPAFSFERVTAADGTVAGVMTIRSLQSTERVRRGMQHALRSIQTRPVDGIVVDLRDNRGGSTETVMHVLAPFAEGNVRLTRQKSWKISDPYKKYLEKNGLGPAAYQRARSGKVIDIEYDPEPLPRAPFRYDGPVAFLVGPRTFSAAVKLADIAQYYDIAVIVGTETGGRPSGFGEGYRFRLPHSGLQAMASTARFLRLDGTTAPRGVVPDVPVPDLQVGETDVALQTAVRVLGSGF
jgi:C-terminal processing protease CtpA/Prc